MRRTLLSALLLLLLAPSSHATMVTYSGTGRVETARSYYDAELAHGRPRPAAFAVGELVSVEVTYDLTPYNNPGFVPVWFFADSAGGGSASIVPFDDDSGWGSVYEVDGVLRGLNAVDGTGSVYIDVVGDLMHVNFGRDDDQGAGYGFTATVTLGVLPSAFPAPEPSTMTLGLVGAALAGAGWMRRRKGR